MKKIAVLLVLAALAWAVPSRSTASGDVASPGLPEIAVCDRDSCSIAVVLRRIKRMPPDSREDCAPTRTWGMPNAGPATYIDTPIHAVGTLPPASLGGQ